MEKVTDVMMIVTRAGQKISQMHYTMMFLISLNLAYGSHLPSGENKG